MKETCEVFGETIEAESREDLKKRMLAKLQEFADGQKEVPRELERKRVEAKLAAKRRL